MDQAATVAIAAAAGTIGGGCLSLIGVLVTGRWKHGTEQQSATAAVLTAIAQNRQADSEPGRLLVELVKLYQTRDAELNTENERLRGVAHGAVTAAESIAAKATGLGGIVPEQDAEQ